MFPGAKVKEGVTSIGDLAFSGCSGLTNLIIPEGVTSIGRSAFDGCSGLTNLIIPEGVTSIGSFAFSGCSGLTSLVLPASITFIGNDAFPMYSNLRSLYLTSKSCPQISGLNYTHYYGVQLFVPQGTLQAYKSSAWGKYFDNIVEYDATGIDDVSTSTNAKPLSRYSVNGQRLTSPAKGLNIVKYSDGSVKKEMVK